MIKETDEIVVMDCDYDDWKSLFVNGKLVQEGHSIPMEFAFEALGIKYKRATAPNDDHGYADFPKEIPCPYEGQHD